MTKNQIVDLVTYVIETDPWKQRAWLEYLCEMNGRFCDFLGVNREKIRKKYRSSSESADKQDDVSSELLFAHMFLLDDRFCLVYEPDAHKRGRSTDYHIIYKKEFTFGLEVKRLRVLDVQARLSRWRERVGIALEETLSPHAFQIDFIATPSVGTLVHNEKAIIEFCREKIMQQPDRLPSVLEWIIPGMQGAAKFTLIPVPDNSSRYAGDYDGFTPVLSTGKEPMKFREIIANTLGQIRNDQANILCIHGNSPTHTARDLNQAMKLIMDPNHFASLARTRHAREIWPDHDQFLEHLKCLNAVVLCGWCRIGVNPPNPVWIQPRPYVTIPKPVYDYVGQMVQ
jgi:hypothetical protein